MPDSIGLYIHIPFCEKKCLYCNFYSACFNETVYKNYFAALIREIKKWGKRENRRVDTIYIGGGTPSLLGEDIKPLIKAIKENFTVSYDAEITAECNPNLDLKFLHSAAEIGVNRLSFGIQAGNDTRLKSLGRMHTVKDAQNAILNARKIGFKNISCDIMIALPGSDMQTLKEDVDFICSLRPEHISAYILKIEKNTALYKNQAKLNLPDEDDTANQYISICETLENNGYEHYEISNFAVRGKKSRHNLKYWRCEEYLGIGPSAHSFLSGKRFYYPNDIKGFIKGDEPVFESIGGVREEKLMLKMRLADGVDIHDFGYDITEKAQKFKNAGLLRMSDGRISLTDKGMLVSNSIITELIYEDL